jgi:phosphoribosylformylglycinamidine synthase
MSDAFILFFKDNNDVTCFYDLKFTGDVHRDVLIDILNIEEVFYSIDKDTDIIIADKPNLISQFVSSATQIFNSLGIKVLFFRKCRVYKNDKVEYDKMTENFYNLDTYIDYRQQQDLVYDKNLTIIDKSDTKVDINSKLFTENFDNEELKYYKNLFSKLNRNPTFTEYFDILQSNSEHARHWFFNGTYFYKDKENYKKVTDKDRNTSLMRMIKSTLFNIDRYTPRLNSLVAFSDNSSVIKGQDVVYFTCLDKDEYFFISRKVNPVLTAETHNFPTLIAPFHGAHTGVGGRIRDNQATGIGAIVLSSLAGYCVGDIYPQLNNKLTKEMRSELYLDYKTPLEILIEASNGASDYGNKFGEPIIGGITRSFSSGDIFDSNKHRVERIEWVKPIMFSAGIGAITEENIKKKLPEPDMFVIRIGGPAYKIGLGGGNASSMEQNADNKADDSSAVQRGDPEMCTKMNNVIRYLIDNNNIIVSLHDQGSGGLGNVVKEIVHPYGAEIYLDNVTLGDNTMTGWEIWSAEFQESNVLLIKKIALNKLEYICKRENIHCDVLGTIKKSKFITVSFKNKTILDLPIEEIVKPNLKKEYILEETSNVYCCKELTPLASSTFYPYLSKVLQNLDVCSKRFLVNKVDRSVTGLVVQQQCVGPFHTPISNYSVTSTSYFNTIGIVTAIGEKPILTLLNPAAAGSMAVGEMLTNMMGVFVGNLTDIKCSGNWMWALNKKGESDKLVKTAISMIDTMKSLGLAIDGGKDSLSMGVNIRDKKVYSPNNLVITGYAHTRNFTKRVTPNLKETSTNLVYIKFSDKTRIGGSVYQREQGLIGGECPDLQTKELSRLLNTWDIIQEYIYKDKILSLHDISDGGLITTLVEMSISSDIGIDIFIDTDESNINNYLFNEELGIVIEIKQPHLYSLTRSLNKHKIPNKIIGATKLQTDISIKNNYNLFFTASIDNLREFWETTSNKLEYLQMSKQLAEIQENERYYSYNMANDYYLNDYIYSECLYQPFMNILTDGPKVAIIRCEGSNGHREMAAAFSMAKFSTFDLHMNDLLETPEILESFRGIVFVGGFSNSDTFGAAQGWGSLIKYSPELLTAFKTFYSRSDTFSLGVCNGCQLMINFNLLNLKNPEEKTKVRLVHNDSKRFESRFSTVKVPKSNSIFFKNLQNVEFGMWVAHGEGKFVNITSKDNIALRYVHKSEPTTKYPYNPNGSEYGVAALSSKNGRHLAIMPHPERCFLKWQLPDVGRYTDIKDSPWVHMFRNAYNFCKKK